MFITTFLNSAVFEVVTLIQLLFTTYYDLALTETQAATWPSSYSKQLVINATLKSPTHLNTIDFFPSKSSFL